MGAGNQNMNAGLDRMVGGVVGGAGSKLGMNGSTNQWSNLLGKRTSNITNTGGYGSYDSPGDDQALS